MRASKLFSTLCAFPLDGNGDARYKGVIKSERQTKMTEAHYQEAIAYAAMFGNQVNAWDVERIATRFPQKSKPTIRADIEKMAQNTDA